MSSPKRVIILGALSSVAESLGRLYAAEGAYLVLVARHQQRLEDLAADLRLRGAAEVHTIARDLATEPLATDLQQWASFMSFVDHIIIFYGVLGDQFRAEIDETYARELLRVDFSSPALWSLASADLLVGQRFGCLVVLGSVAGDRGRRSNYIYGACKGGLATLLQGLAHRLAQVGARAVIIKPGFIATRMTQHLPQKGPLWSSPERVAKIVRNATIRGGPVIYAPGYWRWIMLIVRLIPTWLFHRSNL